MWGAKFGTKHSKIHGVWNPYIYPKDRYGKSIYLKKSVYKKKDSSSNKYYYMNADTMEVSDSIYKIESELLEGGYVKSICPCDGAEIMVKYFPNSGKYKYLKNSAYAPSQDQMTIIDTYNGVNVDIAGIEEMHSVYKESDLNRSLWVDNKRPERAEIHIDNYGDFDYKNYKYTNNEEKILTKKLGLKVYTYRSSGQTEGDPLSTTFYPLKDNTDQSSIDIENGISGAALSLMGYSFFGPGDSPTINYTLSTYQKYVPVDELTDSNAVIDEFTFTGDYYEEINSDDICSTTANAHGYIWNKADLKMVSLEGDQDIYYSENASIRYRMPIDGTKKETMIARQGLYPSMAQNTKEWKRNPWNAKEIVNQNLMYKNDRGRSYIWELNEYSSKIDYFTTVNIPIVNKDTGNEEDYIIRVKVGTFYIIDEWNTQTESPYEMIYPINSGLEDVPYLDRMEKCKATQTFAINTDNNLRMNMYSQMPEYSQSELVVYIDPKTMKPFEPNSDHFHRRNGTVVQGNLRIIKQHDIYYKWTRSKAPEYTTLGHRIVVDAKHFPGTYRLVGETYARSRSDGKDQRYQFEIPLCKMSSETSLTLEAAGDPTTFTMNLRVLRRDDGVMMKLTQYNVDCQKYDGQASGSTKVVPSDGVISTDPIIDDDGFD